MSGTIIGMARAYSKEAPATVADLYAFAQDALRGGIDPRTPIRVRAGFKAQITRLEASETRMVNRPEE